MRALTRCHHHSLQEAIMDRTLIFRADILASFFPHQGPHIPCGWSVKLVDIFLAAINLRFDSQYCLSSFIVFLGGKKVVKGYHSGEKKGNTVFLMLTSTFESWLFSFPVDDHQMKRRWTPLAGCGFHYKRLMWSGQWNVRNTTKMKSVLRYW